MKSAPALIARYQNIRPVQGQKTMQIILEIPIEQATDFVHKFGIPHAGAPQYFALAQIDPDKVLKPGATSTRNAPAREAASDPGEPDAPASRPHKRWDLLSPAQQAGIACADPKFRRFLIESECLRDDTEADAAVAVRLICGVRSRGDIKPGTEAERYWNDLYYSKYQMWLRHPELEVS